MATTTLANKGESALERFLTCSHLIKVVLVGTIQHRFQDSWEMSIKMGFGHVIEASHQIKKREQINFGTQTELQ